MGDGRGAEWALPMPANRTLHFYVVCRIYIYTHTVVLRRYNYDFWVGSYQNDKLMPSLVCLKILRLTACRQSPGCLLPVAICSANTTTTWIAGRRPTRSVSGGSHQQVDSRISSFVGICFYRRQKPPGSIPTEVYKTGLGLPG